MILFFNNIRQIIYSSRYDNINDNINRIEFNSINNQISFNNDNYEKSEFI